MNPPDIDKKQLKQIQQQFVKLSQTRLLRLLERFSQRQADLITILPFLFHVNHPMLPGYVSKHTPSGIPNYFPNSVQQKITKSIGRSFEYKAKAYLKYDIACLFLMGSSGTLAQSVHSDLDLWICLVNPLSPSAYTELQAKTELVSEWMESKVDRRRRR